MDNNDMEKTQSSLDFENQELSVFDKDESEKNIMIDFKPAEINENAQVVLEHRYLLKDNKGDLTENPDGLFRRVANALSKPDKAYGATKEEVDETAEEFYQMLSSLDFLANSPTLMNAGTKLSLIHI